MLDEQGQNECEGLLTEAECLESLKYQWNQIKALEATASQPNFTRFSGMTCITTY